ncbi:O-antigen ligase family protein [Cohaesibacter gelatinilyticus]|nr:O-antigen ligase family protein [Cohaesibacter gelatinilyticus]
MTLSASKPIYIKYFIYMWIFSVSVFTLLGNAASDIWLSMTIVIFLLYCYVEKEWFWLRKTWFQVSFVFWIWLIVTSLISQWPGSSLEDSAAWIRFPLFAIALPILLSRHPKARNFFLAGLIVSLAVLLIVLVQERINNPDAERLYGTWGQSTKSGWLVLGFGLPVSIWALSEVRKKPRTVLWAVPMVALIYATAILTGEIYITLALTLGVSLFLIFSQSSFKLLLSVGTLGIVGIFTIFQLVPQVAQRFQYSLTHRLPWLEGSDYYVPWSRGLEIFQRNPIIGIGPKNHESYCNFISEIASMSTTACYPHPHQLYIQTASETGLIGLTIFLLMIFALFSELLRGKNWRALSLSTTSALCLLITVLWPISTYSHAFGQHKNFFTWLAIAWALSLVASDSNRVNVGKS